MDQQRRRILEGGIAAASLLLPLPATRVWAHSEGAIGLVRAAKVALVLGNGDYGSVPSLRNPVNDARAMADVLRGLGFEPTLKINGSRVEIAAAIAGYTRRLAQDRCVGLFYYAGHALQLSWTNFLVPVDAAIRRPEDVQAACVDLTALLDGMRKAANPLNIVILDACRDNPFERDFRLGGKGLTQMDAPNGTLLAFATAPGNVASDGAGANGVYTESLIGEMRTPGARVEDVFKRVRLTVRRRTSGAQVPWESTSLEEDFWFVPPQDVAQVVEDQVRQEAAERAERKFREELARWDSIRESRDPNDFYAFLLERPSGYLAEQAQFRLDQLEKPRIQAQPGRDGIKPLPSGTNRYALGDAFTWEYHDRLKNVSTRFTQRVTYADNDRVELNGGQGVFDQMGSNLRNRFGTKNPGNLQVPAELAVGKRWRSAFTNTTGAGAIQTNYWDYRVEAIEEIRVPAGTFRAFRVAGEGESWAGTGQTLLKRTGWIDPATMLEIRYELKFHAMTGRRVRATEDSLTELASVTRAPR